MRSWRSGKRSSVSEPRMDTDEHGWGFKLIYVLFAAFSGAMISGCSQEEPRSIVGTWDPLEDFSRERGGYETYRADSTFSRRIMSSQEPYHGKYWLRNDSLFQLFQMPDSNVHWLDSVSELKGERPGGWVMGSFQLTWKGQDTLVMESGPERYKARTVLVRSKK